MILKAAHSWSASTITSVRRSLFSAKSRATAIARSNSSVSPTARSASIACDCLSMCAPSTINTKPRA
jgi:hypothetical protein